MSNYSEPSLINDTDHDLLFKAAYASWLLQQSGGGGSLPDQSGHAGEFLTTDGSTASWAPVQTSPALPVWTYTAGVVASGQFSADQGDPASTTVLTFSDEAKYGQTNFSPFFGSYIFSGAKIYLTNSQGVSVVFQALGAFSSGNLSVQILANAVGSTWSGDYQVLFIPVPDIQSVASASGIASLFGGSLVPPNSLEMVNGLVVNGS